MESTRQEKALKDKAPELIAEGEAIQHIKERFKHWREDARTALDAVKKDYGQAKKAILKLQDSSELLAFMQDKLGRERSEHDTESTARKAKPRKLSS